MEITEDKNQWTGDRGINFTHSEQQRENKLKKEKKKKRTELQGPVTERTKGPFVSWNPKKRGKIEGLKEYLKK